MSKDGHGLERLWQQQLMQFPLVALETAQAIASRYQSPQALIQVKKKIKQWRSSDKPWLNITKGE